VKGIKSSCDGSENVLLWFVNLYMFGPANPGHCQDAFYELFNAYRHLVKSKVKFDQRLATPSQREAAESEERMHINIQLLICLKFWESDMILR